MVASVASTRRDLPPERVDDLRLAVSEACTNAIEAHRAAAVGDPVLVRVWEDDERLDVGTIANHRAPALPKERADCVCGDQRERASASASTKPVAATRFPR